jgi:hypothetical protein
MNYVRILLVVYWKGVEKCEVPFQGFPGENKARHKKPESGRETSQPLAEKLLLKPAYSLRLCSTETVTCILANIAHREPG